jgi:hypothetical protein
MRKPGPTSRAIIDLLDGEGGALVVSLGALVLFLEQKRGLTPEKTSLLHILRRLEDKGEIVKVPTNDGGFLYTRPRNLTRPGYAGMLQDTPVTSRRIRRRVETSDKRWELRERRMIKKWGDEGVARGAHDHRDITRPCPRCDLWPPPPPEKLAALFRQVELTWPKKLRKAH